MIKKIFSYTGALFLALFFFSGVINAHAEKDCITKAQIDSLVAAQQSGANYLIAIKNELKIRKELLKNIVACNIDEVNAPKSTLQAIALTDPDMQRLQTQFLSELTDALSYYQNQNLKIDDLGLTGSQEFAKNIRVWRTYNEFPILDKTANLIMWSRNQALIETAKSRMDYIAQTVQALKLVDSDNIQKLFPKAQEYFDSAETANNQAKDSLRNDENSTYALASIKESLDNLSLMYKTFFELSDAVNKILPHK